jgi:hypothetical protein
LARIFHDFLLIAKRRSKGDKMRLIYVTLSLFLMAPVAGAGSFATIRGGQEYRCEPVYNPHPNAELECENKAYNNYFSKGEARELCWGTNSIAPFECAKAAYAGPFSKAEAIGLCRHSGTIANADCALRAYSGPYSREEALRICRAEPQLVLRALESVNY